MSYSLNFIIVDRSDLRNARSVIDKLLDETSVVGVVIDTDRSKDVKAAFDAATEDPKIGVELDANGTPWIETVHAGTKSKTAAGTWTKRRGVDPADVEAAEVAARAKLAGTPEPVEQPPVEVEETTVAPIDYQDLVNKYIELAGAGLIDEKRMSAIYAECGTTPNDLATNETARAAVMAKLETITSAPATPGLPGLPG